MYKYVVCQQFFSNQECFVAQKQLECNVLKRREALRRNKKYQLGPVYQRSRHISYYTTVRGVCFLLSLPSSLSLYLPLFLSLPVVNAGGLGKSAQLVTALRSRICLSSKLVKEPLCRSHYPACQRFLDRRVLRDRRDLMHVSVCVCNEV